MRLEPERAPLGKIEPDRTAEPVAYVRALLGVLLLSALWRLPSFFDPPWVNDEGTYFAVGQAMAHGYRLYDDIWENKPPALYLLYTGVYHLLGPSLITVRVLASIAALSCVLLTFLIARRYASVAPSLAGAMLAGLLLGVPFLEGTTANAEIFLAAFTALAVYLGVGRDRPALAGAAAGAAILFKVVAGFDAAAIALWLILHRRRASVPFVAVLLAVLLCTIVLVSAFSILHAMLQDAVLYDFGYVGNKNGGGIPWILLAKLGVLLVGTVALRRAPFPCLWLLYASAGALVSGRFFGHYALQAVVPLCVVAALALAARSSLSRRLLVLLPAGFCAAAILAAAAGWGLAARGHDSILVRRLQWYANFVRYAAGAESAAAYRAQIDDHVNRNIAVADRLRALPPGRLLVWGNSPWIYVLSARLPATPYTSALRDPPVPGERSALSAALRQGRGREVVIISPPAPPLGSASGALRGRYRRVGAVGNATIFVSAG